METTKVESVAGEVEEADLPAGGVELPGHRLFVVAEVDHRDVGHESRA